MITQAIEKTQFKSAEKYQFIKEEELFSVVISSQLLAGSRVQKSTYRQVVFSDCVFHSTDFQSVTFDNCIFENCSFEFSHFRHCKFENCNFTNCTWKASSSIDSLFKKCDFPPEWYEYLNYRNEIEHEHYPFDYSTDIYIELAVA